MATVHAHPALQAMAVEQFDQEHPLIPTLTDPDMLLPDRDTLSSPHRTSESSFLSSDTEPSPSSSSGIVSPASSEAFELSTATAFLLPMRPKPPPPLSHPRVYSGYEHGAPLSDIGEEEMTPRSKRARSRTPSPTASSPTIVLPAAAWWSQRPEKRLSEMSSSSGVSTGGDLHWESFDAEASMSDRLRADLAAARDDTFILDELGSQRNSTATNGDDEFTTQALSKRAEQILANAKKRLTNMEGNLSKARTSLSIEPKASPSIGEHQPVGGLYRSISQGPDRRLLPGSNPRKSRTSHSLTKGANPVHARNWSETSVPSRSARRCDPPEVRSASAMESGYGGKSIDFMLYERSKSLTNGHFPTLKRSQTSPLTTLQEEETGPSTDIPAADASGIRGLGMKNRRPHSRSTSNTSEYCLTRSQSQTSTRGVPHEINGSRTKTAGLRTGHRPEQLRRNSLQNLRSPSSITAAEEWYTGAAEYQGGNSALSTNAGTGWRHGNDEQGLSANQMKSARSPRSPQPSRPGMSPRSPRSPSSTNGLATEDPLISPFGTAHSGPDLRSYPTLSRPPATLRTVDDHRDDQDSYIQESHYEDAFEDRSSEAEDSLAASEEEQIFLNEVLEESLQDAEPEVPPIPDVSQAIEPERHEDRADAFDYENFFLHSALGNYSRTTGLHRRNISQTTVDSQTSYESSDSVETTRAPQAEENGWMSEREAGDERGDARERTHDGTFLEDEAPTPTATAPSRPFAQHFRCNSIDSVSSAATFETATEGGNDSGAESDTLPSEILHWGERPAQSMVGAWPSPPATTPQGLTYVTNGHVPPLSKNIAPAEILRPSSGTLPTPPESSPLQQVATEEDEEREEEEEQEQEEADNHYGDGGDDDDDDDQLQPPNTEILISALITLANPDFKPNGPFSEVDRDLVVNVLRSVGAVCQGINASDSSGEVYQSRVWRRRLYAARRILDGEIEVEDE